MLIRYGCPTSNSQQTRVYRIGSRNVGVLIVGRSPGGRLLGIRTRVVET